MGSFFFIVVSFLGLFVGSFFVGFVELDYLVWFSVVFGKKGGFCLLLFFFVSFG